MSARLKYKYEAQKSNQLNVDKGEVVQLLEKVSNGKWYVALYGGKTGLIQANYMDIIDDIEANLVEDAKGKKTDKVTCHETASSCTGLLEAEKNDKVAKSENVKQEVKQERSKFDEDKTILHESEVANKVYQIGRMKFKFEAQKEEELTCEQGEEIKIIRKVNDFWVEVSSRGKTGLVQSNYVDILERGRDSEDNREAGGCADESINKSGLYEGQERGNYIDEKQTATSCFETLDKNTKKKWMKLTDKVYEKKHSPKMNVIKAMSFNDWIIFLDVYQVIGVLCSFGVKHEAFSFAIKNAGYMFSIVSLDFASLLGEQAATYFISIPLILFEWLMVLCLFGWWRSNNEMCKAKKNEYAILDGEDNEEAYLKRLDKRHCCCSCVGWRSRLIINYVLYLPAVRTSFQVLNDLCLAFPEYCTVWKILIGICCGIPLLINPILLMLMVKKNSPKIDPEDPVFGKGGVHEKFGHFKYYDLLQSNEYIKSPFHFLYGPFHRSNRFDRSLTMVKKALITATIYAGGLVTMSYAFFFWMQTVYLVLHVFSHSAYYENASNRLDFSGTVSVWLVSVLTISVTGVGEQNLEVIDLKILQIPFFVYVLGVLLGFATICFFLNFQFDKLLMPFQKKLRFENTHDCRLSNFRDIFRTWDPDLEIKNRLWQPFWDAILMKCMGRDVSTRWNEILSLTEKHGLTKMLDHFQQEKIHPNVIWARNYIMSECDGVDCWWDPNDNGSDEDYNQPTNMFGKLEIIQFPFTCYFEYDIGGRVEFSDAKSIIKLAEQNKSSIVQIRKETRLTLRAMTRAKNDKVKFPYKEGRYEAIDKLKKGSTTEFEMIDMDISCENCNIYITASDGSNDIINKPGFNVTAVYEDSYGRGVFGSREYTVHGRTTKVGLEGLGIDKDFQPIDGAECIVTSGEMMNSSLPNLEYECKTETYEYRKNMHDARKKIAATVPFTFWDVVYNNPNLKREDMEKLMRSFQDVNKTFSEICTAEKEAFYFIFARMNDVQGHPHAGLWFVFWHDVWVQNRHLLCMRKVKNLLNPTNPRAICYRVIERVELELLLRQNGLLSRKDESEILFSKRMLDVLYFRIQKLQEWADIDREVVKAAKSDGRLMRKNTMQQYEKRELLNPILLRAAAKHHQVEKMTSLQHGREVLYFTAYANIWLLLMGLSCIFSPSICLVRENSTQMLMLVVPPLGSVIVGLVWYNLVKKFPEGLLSICKINKLKTSKVGPSSKQRIRGESPRDPIRWWEEDAVSTDGQIDFNQHDSVLNHALMFLRKGKSCEVEHDCDVGNTEKWDDYAIKHYTKAASLFDLLPIEEAFAQSTFIADRQASLFALRVLSDDQAYNAATTQFKALGVKWLHHQHDSTLKDYDENKGHHNAAIAFEKLLLCFIAKGDLDQAAKSMAESKAYFPDIDSIDAFKRFHSVLKSFLSLDIAEYEATVSNCVKKYGLNTWYKHMYKNVQLGAQSLANRVTGMTRADEDSESEGISITIKILLAGEVGVGKTSFLVRYLYNTFVANPAIVLAGKKEYAKVLDMDNYDEGAKLKVIFEEVSSVSEYKKVCGTSVGVVYMYDADRRHSLSNEIHKEWLDAFDWSFGAVNFASTKIDNDHIPTTNGTPTPISDWMAKYDSNSIKCFQVSSKTGEGVADALNDVVAASKSIVCPLHCRK